MTTSGLGLLSLTSREVERAEHGHGGRGAMEVSRVRCEEDGDGELDMLLLAMLWSKDMVAVFSFFHRWVEVNRSS
jgi:hypothetical protein